MSFDNLCKLLAEQYPDRFAAWILGQQPASIKVLKTELGIEPIRADYVTFLQTQERILHLEFQVKVESNPPLPLRMLDYWVRLYRLYRLPVTQVVVLLLPPSDDITIETVFALENTRHEYRMLRMWEQDPQFFLNDPILLPFAPLAATDNPERLLNGVAEQVNRVESAQERQRISSYVQLLAGLKFKKELVRQIFREGIMRESVIYQEILEEGKREGLQTGRQEGRQEGKQEGLQAGRQEEGLTIVLRLLTRRIGTLDQPLKDRIAALSLPLLEELGEALLDFSAPTDLETWLSDHPVEA